MLAPAALPQESKRLYTCGREVVIKTITTIKELRSSSLSKSSTLHARKFSGIQPSKPTSKLWWCIALCMPRLLWCLQRAWHSREGKIWSNVSVLYPICQTFISVRLPWGYHAFHPLMWDCTRTHSCETAPGLAIQHVNSLVESLGTHLVEKQPNFQMKPTRVFKHSCQTS